MCQRTLFFEAGLDSEDVTGTDTVRRSEQQTSPAARPVPGAGGRSVCSATSSVVSVHRTYYSCGRDDTKNLEASQDMLLVCFFDQCACRSRVLKLSIQAPCQVKDAVMPNMVPCRRVSPRCLSLGWTCGPLLPVPRAEQAERGGSRIRRIVGIHGDTMI